MLSSFSPEGGSVEIFTIAARNAIRICVKDVGPGIPEEFRPRIFGKFSQADSSTARTRGGTGLGLNITKQIVEHMGGKIGFYTKMGLGTTFWAEFPTENMNETASAELVIEASTFTKNTSVLPKILHVEDDDSLVSFFSNALQDKVQIVPAKTLQDAKEKLKNDSISLIILDIGMPDGSGIDLLNYLNETEHRNIPVVILSAIEASEEIRNRVAAHMVKSRMSEVKIIEEILQIMNLGTNAND